MTCKESPVKLPFPDGQEVCAPPRLAVLRREEVWGARGLPGLSGLGSSQHSARAVLGWGVQRHLGVAALVSAAAAPSEH